MPLPDQSPPDMRKLSTKLKRIAISIMAVIGALAVVVHGIVPLVQEKASSLKVFPSPHNLYKAVLFNRSGGGGLSPYCFNSISVVPSTVSDSAADDEKYTIYVGGCHAVAESDFAPSIKWLSGVELEITFDPGQVVNGVSKAILRGTADAGKVFILYKAAK